MEKRAIFFIALVTLAFYGTNYWFSQKQQKKTSTWVAHKKAQNTTPKSDTTLQSPSSSPSFSDEEFYVLQNSYQQLVFSTRGGALSEINLSLHSPNNKKSPINSIEIDKKIVASSPNNARFPAHPYYIVTENGREKITQGRLGGYYPLLRRTLNMPNDLEKKILPKYYGLNTVSDENAIANAQYKVVRFTKDLITFETTYLGQKITKTFSLSENPKAPYVFDMTLQLENGRRNIWLNSGVLEAELISGKFSPSLKYEMNKANKPYIEQIKLSNSQVVVTSILPNWVSNGNGFFGIIINPLDEIGQGYKAQKIPGTQIPTRLTLVDAAYDLYPAQDYPGYEISLPLGASNRAKTFRIYAGPYEKDFLALADKVFADPTVGYNPNYIAAQSFHGWFSFISEPFAKFLFLVMQLFHSITFSWGISIILLTIVLRAMLYPLNAWSIRANAKMQEVGPLVKSIQEKYKRDPKRAQMEIMKLYQEKKANPLMGCFPILIQIPFLIGMFDLLKSTFELRGATFIPGWIDNLTAPDVLFSWNMPVVFFGTQFHLLPILLGLVMFVQQKFTTNLPKDKSQWTDQQKQAKTVGTFMAILFTFLFYKFPSGLNIYWLSSSLLGILQQWYMKKNMKKTPVVPVKAFYKQPGKKRK